MASHLALPPLARDTLDGTERYSPVPASDARGHRTLVDRTPHDRRDGDPGLIALADPSDPLPPGLLDARGGFAWWYVDLLDARGDGFVLIWSFGLPFLPGVLDGARRGRPERPADRPSLNLVLYRRFHPVFYQLQTYAPGDAAWDPAAGTWRFGDSSLEGRVEGGDRVLEAVLDCPIAGAPGARLSGRISLHGPARRPGDADAAPSAALPHHAWSPLAAPAWGRADLAFGGEAFSVAGLAYHDCNGGSVPFDRLGIRRWIWGRALHRDELRIWYVLWPEDAAADPVSLGVTVDAGGFTRVVDDLAVERGPRRRATYGMRWEDGLVLRRGGRPWLEARPAALVDDGPFYLRLAQRVTDDRGRAALGWSEVVEPGRADRPLHRPFVRMRVHDTAGPNSRWLPLFSGPRSGRLRRLLAAAVPARLTEVRP